jgi:PhnB protein
MVFGKLKAVKDVILSTIQNQAFMKKVERKSQKKTTKAIPKGFHTVTPYLVVNDARGLLEFIEKAFDGEVTSNMKGEDGRIMHATVQIGDSVIMVSDVMKGMNEPMPTMLYLYVDDVDAMYRQAINANATSIREPIDEFYGDRSAGVRDEWNNQWWLATHIEDISSEEMERRKEEFLKKGEHMSHA